MSTQETNYLANPEALADMSVEQLEALALGGEAVKEGDTNSDATPGAATEEPTGKAETEPTATTEEAKAAETAAAATEEDAEGVLSKDGKHVLPFSVLQGTRAEKARLEQVVREQQEALTRLQEAQQQGKTQERDPEESGEQPAKTLSADELAAVEQEFPALGKVLRAQQKAISDLTGQVVEERQAQAAAAQDRAFAALERVEQRVAKLELQAPAAKRASIWMDRAAWAAMAAVAVYVAKATGLQ